MSDDTGYVVRLRPRDDAARYLGSGMHGSQVETDINRALLFPTVSHALLARDNCNDTWRMYAQVIPVRVAHVPQVTEVEAFYA